MSPVAHTKLKTAPRRAPSGRPPKVPLEPRRDISTIDVLDRVLDKGIVIDYWARVSVLGIDLLTTVEARVVVASFDTYLHHAHHAEAIRGVASLAGALSARALEPSQARPRSH
jgi:hypothetical protein